MRNGSNLAVDLAQADVADVSEQLVATLVQRLVGGLLLHRELQHELA